MSDSAKVFLDANVLVCARDGRYPNKRKRDDEILRSVQDKGGGVASTQILQECHAAATTKLGIKPLTAKEALVELKALELVLADFAVIQDATDTSILNRISFWDALIVVSAVQAACAELLTEDWNDGQVIRGVRRCRLIAMPAGARNAGARCSDGVSAGSSGRGPAIRP